MEVYVLLEMEGGVNAVGGADARYEIKDVVASPRYAVDWVQASPILRSVKRFKVRGA
jgi:hypothetical protein